MAYDVPLCLECKDDVKENDRAISCDSCDGWTHILWNRSNTCSISQSCKDRRKVKLHMPTAPCRLKIPVLEENVSDALRVLENPDLDFNDVTEEDTTGVTSSSQFEEAKR
ncbi:hypothetical protein DPMN_019440 [Dreissena polymorpha]|uniref:Uncharacterized protein n=1 Tax=Dreissena polymorpha TaxID=45954 RepID=A0A9D4NKU3_DREPO|nr:hypothetical protein DPMN_019440 [Dreissena polymorpha]